MAEAGLAATIIDIAGAGVKLSIRLYTFAETVATASSEIKNIARDVSFTSSVLDQLGSSLKQDEEAKLSSGAADQTAKDVLNECEFVFKEIDDVLTKASDGVAKRWPKKGGKLVLSASDRLKWPFLQPRMALLRGNLERLKSTLVLMLNVLTYARDLKTEKNEAPRENEVYRKTLLENLLHANQQATRKYEALLKAMESQGDNAQLATLMQDATSESDLDWSVRDPLKRIEKALLQFERSAPISYGNSRMAVQIEVEKDITRARGARGRPTPWVLVSIGRKEQEVPPSYNESWIPSEGEVYDSFAGGALEGLTVDDYRERSRSRSRVRFQEQYQDSYQDYRYSQPGPSRRGDAGQGEIDETMGLMHDNGARVSQRGDRYQSPNNVADPLNSGAVKFQKGARTKTWYSSILDSIPSPTTAITSIQKTVKNTGLFFGVEDERENPDTVLEYKNSRLASPPNSPGAKLVRSTTFDEMLRSPSSEGQYTPPSTTVSKEEASETEKPAEAATQASQSVPGGDAPKNQQKIPFLVPTEDEVKDHSGRTTPEPTSNAEAKSPDTEAKQVDGNKIETPEEKAEDAKENEKVGQQEENQPSDEAVSAGNSKGKGKAKEIAPANQPDEIDELVKEWTTVYE